MHIFQVRDGGDETAPAIGRVCGDTLPPPIVTTQNQLWVKFRSDPSNTRPGFRAEWSRGKWWYLEPRTSPGFRNWLRPCLEQGCPTVALWHQCGTEASKQMTRQKLYSLYNSLIFGKHDRMILFNVPHAFLNTDFTCTCKLHLLVAPIITGLHFANTGVPPYDNIQTNYLHIDHQELLCSKTRRLEHPCWTCHQSAAQNWQSSTSVIDYTK